MLEQTPGVFFDHHEPFVITCYVAVTIGLLGLYVLTKRRKAATEKQIERLQRRLHENSPK